LSAHFATPGWLKPTGEYTTESIVPASAEIAETTFFDRVTAAIPAIVIPSKEMRR
jgi:hypothetical protein